MLKNANLTGKYTLLLLLLSLLLFLPGIHTIPMVDRDSAHFAQATKQMLETGNYFQIRFQDRTRYQKPPGINWLQAASVKLFSSPQSESIWAYRLPSTLGGLLAVLLLFFFSRRFISEKAAFVASCLLACSLLLVVESHLMVIDASLLATIVLMQGALLTIYLNESSDLKQRNLFIYVILFWLAMSWGISLKGVTPLVGFGTIISLCLFDRNIRWLKGLRFHWGIPLLLLSSAWILFVNEAEGTNYLWKIIQKDLLPKLQGGHESHGAPFGVHTLLLPLTFWPLSILLGLGFIWAWQKRRAPLEKFLIAWILPTWLFFELMPTKLPQYILPIFPAFAILIALAITDFKMLKISRKQTLILRCLYVAWALFSIAFITIALIWMPYYIDHTLNLYGLIATAILLPLIYLAAQSAWQENFKKTLISLVSCSAICFVTLYQLVFPKLENIWITEKISQAIHQIEPNFSKTNEPLYSIGYDEPSLAFKLGTKKVDYVFHNLFIQAVVVHEKVLAIIDSEYLNIITESLSTKGITLNIESTIKGFNYSRGKWVELVLASHKDENVKDTISR